MSHFLKIRTEIREREHLVQALRDLHYQFQVGENLYVRGWAGNRERAEIVVDTGSEYDIGFRRETEIYEAIADWQWGVERNTKIRQKSFLQQLNERYSYNLIREYVRENLIWEKEERLPNGDLMILLSERG